MRMENRAHDWEERRIAKCRSGVELNNNLDSAEVVIYFVICALMIVLAIGRLDERTEKRQTRKATIGEMLNIAKTRGARPGP